MNLKWNLFTRGLKPHAQLERKLQGKIGKLEEHLAHFPQDAVHLQVSLERDPKKDLFAAALTLHLPSNTLRARKTAEDPVPALDSAIKTLLRELSALKAVLRHENTWQKQASRADRAAAWS